MHNNITIQELEDRNLSPEQFFRVICVITKYELAHIAEFHPSLAVNVIDDYPLQIVNRILVTANTLHTIIQQEQDYVVASSIIRSMADMLATYILIYDSVDVEERTLRHYLYIIDGLSKRLKLLPNELLNDGRLNDEEFFALKTQVEEARANYGQVKNLCIENIEKLSLSLSYPKQINELIGRGNWRFIDVSKPKNAYSWGKLYDMIGLKLDGQFISSLSEFVHGLSTSLLIMSIDYTTFTPVYCLAISLLGKMRELLYKGYARELESFQEKIISVLADEAMPIEYVKYIVDQSYHQRDASFD